MRRNNLLRQIFANEHIVIDSTHGTDKISQATDVFKGGIDDAFRYYGLDIVGLPTNPTQAIIYEGIGSSHNEGLFTSVTRDVHRVWLEQSQIVYFCWRHKNKLLRQEESIGNLFLIKAHGIEPGNNTKIKVARVFSNNGELAITRHDLLDPEIHKAQKGFQVITPKLYYF